MLKLNSEEAEGRKVECLYYGREGECSFHADSSKGTEIIVTSEYHGEYDIVWFVVFKNGIELTRVNAKYVESFTWFYQEA